MEARGLRRSLTSSSPTTESAVLTLSRLWLRLLESILVCLSLVALTLSQGHESWESVRHLPAVPPPPHWWWLPWLPGTMAAEARHTGPRRRRQSRRGQVYTHQGRGAGKEGRRM